jgi:hypothetical protein
MEGLVHITHEMDQKLEGFAGNGITDILVHPVLQQFRSVLDTIKDIDPFSASPKARARKGTRFRGEVVQSTDIM